MSLSVETAAFAAEYSEAEESDSTEGPGVGEDEDDFPADKNVFVPAVFVVPPSTEDCAPPDPNSEGPFSVVLNPEGPASTVPYPEGPAEVDG